LLWGEPERTASLLLDSPDGVQTIIDRRDAAESAGLRYISDARPGIRRKKAGTVLATRVPTGRGCPKQTR
jgi:DNA topoisomerase I